MMATDNTTKMDRNQFTQFARQRMNEFGLKDWKLRISMNGSYLGLCDHKNKTIYLNGHHIDINPEKELKNTVNHEIAHALVGAAHGHDEVWSDKARECGCDNTLPCATYSLNPAAIDAIRSGDLVEVEYEEQVIRTPKHRITRFQDKCDVCGRVAKERSTKEFRSNGLLKKIVTLECGHIRIVDSDSQSEFDLIVSNDWQERIKNCKHVWNKNQCRVCGEYRLFPFQVLGARFLEKQNGRAAIFDEMGLGKTPQSLAYLKFHPEAFPVLFIVKSGIKYQWMKEIVRWLGEKYFPQVLQSGRDGVMPGLKCYITSYDLLRRFDTTKLHQLGIKTVVMDEVQAIKNPDATRTQEVRKLIKEIPHIIPLSGTPWKNRGSEFFVVLNILDRVKFWSFQSFVQNWVEEYYDGTRVKQGGIHNPTKFKEHIKDIAIRRERWEVMPELPTVNRMRLHCKMGDIETKAYDEEISEFVKYYNEKVINGEEDDAETQQNVIARLQRMRHILGLAKIPATVDFVTEFLEETDRKLIVFVHHKDVGQILYNQLKDNEEHVEVMALTADLSAEERFDMQERFNKLPRCVLVASTLASGEGLNLQTCADQVMHERQWNPMNEEQAEGRSIRIGQQATSVNVTYIHADHKGSTDLHLDALVEEKRIQFHNVMNKGVIPTWSEVNIMKELTESIIAAVSPK